MAHENATPIDTTSVRAVKAPELSPGDEQGRPLFAGNLELIQNVKVQLAVSLGTGELTVAELFALKEGAVVALEQASDAPLDILLDGRLIARGELVVAGDHFGVRITRIGSSA